MAKIWGLDIPIEFQTDFAKVVKLNWSNTQQRATPQDSKPARARSLHIAGRSFIPDFLDDWFALTEEEQTAWAKDWGSGGQQAFALFFQNNFYRQLNALELRSTPNFFTAPAGWLHIAAGDDSVILNFNVTSGDYILSDPANILHLQNQSLCEFENTYTISATLQAKLKNIASPGAAICTATITQYYTGNGTPKSRQAVKTAVALSEASFTYPITHTFTKVDAVEVVTGFKIEFQFDDAAGDIWFFENTVTAIDSVLGALRFHNVINFQDVEKVFANHLADVKNQWSLSGAAGGTTLRRVFPYAFGYPEEGEGPNLIYNGDFALDSDGWALDAWAISSGIASISNADEWNDLYTDSEHFFELLSETQYQIDFDFSIINGTLSMYVYDPVNDIYYYDNMDCGSGGHFSQEFTSYQPSSTSIIYFFVSAGASATLDNISLRQI